MRLYLVRLDRVIPDSVRLDRVRSDLDLPLMNAFVVFLQHYFPQLFILLLQTLQHALVLHLKNHRTRVRPELHHVCVAMVSVSLSAKSPLSFPCR